MDLAGHRLFKRVEIVNSLPGVRALVKKILIDIGNRGRVRVDAAGAGENSLEKRAFAISGKRRRHARLHHAVAIYNPPQSRAELRPIQGMRHGADQARRSPARKSRIRVERDDVTHSGDGFWGMTRDGNEICLRGTAQQLVQFVQLAALAFPSHPFLFAFVPDALAMKQEETRPAVSGRTMALLRLAMPLAAAASSSSSPGRVSVAASTQSVSSANRKSPSMFAR